MKFKSQFKNDVRAVCRELKKEFFAHEWSMTLLWMAEDDDKDEDKQTAASIPIDNRYLSFRVKIFPVFQTIWTEDKDRFFEILVHEFCHLLTEPLYDIAVNAISNREGEHLEDIRERQTQRICNVLCPYLKKAIFTIKRKPHARKKHRPNTRKKRN